MKVVKWQPGMSGKTLLKYYLPVEPAGPLLRGEEQPASSSRLRALLRGSELAPGPQLEGRLCPRGPDSAGCS